MMLPVAREKKTLLHIAIYCNSTSCVERIFQLKRLDWSQIIYSFSITAAVTWYRDVISYTVRFNVQTCNEYYIAQHRV